MSEIVVKPPREGWELGRVSSVAEGPDGSLYVLHRLPDADAVVVLEYDTKGRRVREWGKLGRSWSNRGPGEFIAVHGIAIDDKDIVYVADRLNGRIQRFQRDGTYLGMWEGIGKVSSLFWDGSMLWAGVQRLDQPNSSQGWLLKLDTNDGTVAGLIAVPETHSVSLTSGGEPIIGALPNRVFKYQRIPTR